MAPQRLSKRSRQTLRIVHIVSSVGWLGAGLSQLICGLIVLNSADIPMRHYTFELGATSGPAICAPLAIISAASGILLGVRTEWGLLRHRWVAVKLVLTIGIIIFGTAVLGGLSEDVATQTASTTNPDAGIATGQLAMMGGAGNLLILVFIVVISVVKPWGKRTMTNRPILITTSGATES